MSVEELKIREELEVDVENDLEEEIKEGIYHLALKLHRLYQHQKARRSKQPNSDENPRKKMLSEVNIYIRMEGGTTIQIKENKKETAPNKPAAKNINVKGNIAPPRSSRGIKFDWANSLRSASNPLNANQRCGDKINPNPASRKGKLDKGIKTQSLELGWKC